MTKRLISLMLVLIMLFSLCLTSCGTTETTEAEGEEGETAEEEVMRPNVGLTIYAVSDKKINDETLKEVQEKVSNYCLAKYKTSIRLKIVTEGEYQAALDEQYAKFAAEEAAKLKAEQEAAERSRSRAAERAKLKNDPDALAKFDQKIREEERKAAEEAEKKAAAEAEKIAKGEDKIKWSDMDIIYIPGQAEYTQWVNEGKLVDMKTFLENSYKKIRDYVYPTFLQAATVNGGIYGIPNNRDINTNETYLVVNTALAEKYGVDLDAVRSITDLEAAFAAVKAGEAGVTPIYGDFDPEGVVFYDGLELGNFAGVYADTLVGGTELGSAYEALWNPETENNAMADYFALKAAYRANGYISDTNTNFFASVQELTAEQKAEWEAKGYTLHLYKGAEITKEAVFESGLFGISKYSDYPERAMEVLTLMTTDADFHNLLTFGIEEVHYIVNADDKNVITKLNDDYSMNFFKTGNSLLGYVTDDMDPDYVANAKTKNLNAFISPYYGYKLDTESMDEAKLALMETAKAYKAYLDPIYAQLSYGTPAWKEIMTAAYNEVYNNENGTFDKSFKDWEEEFPLAGEVGANLATIVKLRDELGIEDLTEPKAAEPVTTTTAAAAN